MTINNLNEYVVLLSKSVVLSNQLGHIKRYSDDTEHDRQMVKTAIAELETVNHEMQKIYEKLSDDDKQSIPPISSLSSYNLRKATLREYNSFLKLYFANGGEYTHKYNLRFSRGIIFKTFLQDIYIVTADSIHIPLCGSDSRIVIVPEHIKYNSPDAGHDTIMRMSNPTDKLSFVPSYLGTIPHLSNGGN